MFSAYAQGPAAWFPAEVISHDCTIALVVANRAYLLTEEWFCMKKLCFQWDGNTVNGTSWGLTSREKTDLHVQSV